MALTDRERAAYTTQLIVEEFRRTGILPSELLRSIQAHYARRTGSILPVDKVEAEARSYVERLMAQEGTG